MTVETVLEQLEANARTLYRKAIDADNQLDKLKAEGLGKFHSIFKPEQGFATQSTRFMPYVEEVGKDILALKAAAGGAEFEQHLQRVVQKMELLFATLAQFKSGISQ